MGLTVKFVLPLIGAIMLCGLVAASRRGYDDVNSLPAEEKRRIIRELLRAQKDIRKALLKIHFHLDGEELEEDDDDEFGMKICWDKELGQFRKGIEKKMAALSKGLKHANEMLDEIEYYGPGGAGGQYGGQYGAGYGVNRPDKPDPSRPPPPPPPPTEGETTVGIADENAEESEDEYYNRRLKTGGNRRYGRQMQIDEKPAQDQAHEKPAQDREAIKAEPNPYFTDAIESDVAEAIEQLAADTE